METRDERVRMPNRTTSIKNELNSTSFEGLKHKSGVFVFKKKMKMWIERICNVFEYLMLAYGNGNEKHVLFQLDNWHFFGQAAMNMNILTKVGKK